MRRALLLVALVGWAVGCNSASKEPGKTTERAPTEGKFAFVPLPTRERLATDQVAIGRLLFDDKILSDDGTVACTSCHLREKGLSNGKRYADLPSRPASAAGSVNVPTLYNVRYNYMYNWSGRFLTLAEQLDALIVKDTAMASSWASVAKRLGTSPGYARLFRDAFADGVTEGNVRTVLIEYVKSLTTPGSRFDHDLAGDATALTREEKAGFLLFESLGCSSCHQGRNIGGGMRQRFGISEVGTGLAQRYFERRGTPVTDMDKGYGAFTKDPDDMYYFRVPSLRNVALTAPYFHDGSAATLTDAIKVMGQMQLGRELEASEIYLLESFLNSLTGEVDGAK